MNQEQPSTWVVWVPSQKGYLISTEYPTVVTSYEWHAEHYKSKSEALAAAFIAKGEAREARS